MRPARRFTASVVTYESDEALLERLLDTLGESVARAARAYDLDATLFLVVNDEDAARVAALERLVAERVARPAPPFAIRTLVGHGNVGYGPGQNLAIRAIDSDYHLVLNPDIVVEPDVVLECIRYLDAHPEVALLAPQGFDQHREYARLAKRYPSVLVLLLRALAVRPSSGWLGRRVTEYTYGRELPTDVPTPVELASGCFMFCRSTALKRVNGFDERYFLYFEDYDLSLKIRRFGEIREVPFARITHYGGQTARRGVRRIAYFLRSAVTFFTTHGWSWH